MQLQKDYDKQVANFLAHPYTLFFIALFVLLLAWLFEQITSQFFIGSLLTLLAIDSLYTGLICIGSGLSDIANAQKTKSP